MEKLIELLNQCNVDDYKIVEKSTISHQAFFIKQQLDQHRISDVKHTNLTVYVNKDGKIGSSTKEIFNGETEKEIVEDIEEMKFNASLALNPSYSLVSNRKYFEEKSDFNLLNSLKNVISAVQSINDTETEKINSYEVFINQNYYHVVNSRGVDLSFNSLDEMVEIVINSINENHEVEVYHMINCGVDQSVENIVADIKNVFTQANNRSKADKVKQENGVRVLLAGSDVRNFFRYFVSKTSTSSIYSQTSQVKLNDFAQKGDDCDKVTIDVKANLPFSSKNMPFDLDGLQAKDFTLVKDGQYVSYHGDNRTASYLGLTDISFANNIVVSGGSKTVEQLRSKPYLEVVEFSSFDMNPVTGDFGGEFRLAYYFDGTEVKPVTSGSITCNMNEVLDHLHFSKETIQYNDSIVPVLVEIDNVDIAGN